MAVLILCLPFHDLQQKSLSKVVPTQQATNYITINLMVIMNVIEYEMYVTTYRILSPSPRTG